jgi:hypothetical protein
MAAGSAPWVPLQPSEARQARRHPDVAPQRFSSASFRKEAVCHLDPFPALPFKEARHRATSIWPPAAPHGVSLQPSEAKHARRHLDPFPARPFKEARRRATSRWLPATPHGCRSSQARRGKRGATFILFQRFLSKKQGAEQTERSERSDTARSAAPCINRCMLRNEAAKPAGRGQCFCTATGMTTRTVTTCKLCVYASAPYLYTYILCVCLRLFCLQKRREQKRMKAHAIANPSVLLRA